MSLGIVLAEGSCLSQISSPPQGSPHSMVSLQGFKDLGPLASTCSISKGLSWLEFPVGSDEASVAIVQHFSFFLGPNPPYVTPLQVFF